jgi:hypothetical protein
MTREQLEHIVRAAGAIADEQEILVLGSQSILGSFPQPPENLAVSREADVCPLRDPSKADLISGAIGEISQFDSTFGYFTHGLPAEACPLPKGWETRLVAFRNANTRGASASFDARPAHGNVSAFRAASGVNACVASLTSR